jgi:hypothetical protein
MAINFDSFTQTEEWQTLIRMLDSMGQDFVRDIVFEGAKGNIAAVQHLTGKIAMIEQIKTIPEYFINQQRQQKGGRDATHN